MNQERMMVAEQILFGNLDPSLLTLEEVYELQDLVFEAIATKHTQFATHDTEQ